MDEPKLIQQYQGLVKFYVGEISARVPRWVDRDDLTSAGMVGLLHALRSFDPDRGVNFLTFARLRIRGAVYDELRRAHPMGRAALRHGVSVESRAEVIERVDDSPPDAGLLRREQSVHLHEAVDALPPRLRFVVNGYYFQGRQIKELAAEFGVSAPRVSKMHARALSHLRNSLEGPMTVTVYRDKEGLWRWHARAGNGEIVSESGEGFEDKSWAIQSAKKFGPRDAVIITDDSAP
jgi:RNA polymerase sigma factor FliA